MKNLYLFVILSLCSTHLFAVETVRIRTDVELIVNGTTTPSTISLNSDKPSGDGTSETAPGNIYLPIQKDDIDTKSFFIEATNALSPTIFDISNPAHVANIPLRVNTNGSDRYLYAAVKNSSNTYTVVKSYGALINPNTTNGDLTFHLAPYDICRALTTCTNLASGSVTESQLSAMVYFFLSNQTSYNYGTDVVDVAVAPYNTGIYFQVNMSNQVFTDTELTISINNVLVGDKRLTLEYTATGTLGTNAKSLRVFKHDTPTPAVQNDPIADYTGALLPEIYDYAQNGKVIVTNLSNDTDYTISLLFVDKFNFATTLSIEKTATPLEIQELLKKQACFLLTAGFGEEHYVINYFRHFRDTVLAQSFLGKKFISVYYDLAPKYALIIYQHEYIRAFIRGVGYTLYFIFNYYALILLSAALLLCGIYLHKNKDKIKI
jgi:hypothetical protein